MLEKRIVVLKRELMGFAGLVEHMIGESTSGLLRKDREALLSIIENEEPRANAYELELDELCIRLIAQYEPKAKDLRTIIMALKMNNDLERMGDHAVNIAESALYLIERPPVKPLVDIPRMAEEVIAMLRDGLRAFVDQDAVRAKSVCERDDTVDNLADQIRLELARHMAQDPATIERALHLLKIAANLERIADLSTNICEEVIFMAEGRVIKHGGEKLKSAGR
jgi:phosphate transport system protein